MITGVVLLQLVTGNQLVRLLLGSVGAVKPVGEPQPSDKLKGGRLLGPMERLLILGLGLAGQLAAATAVVAAKSIIRFPEINAQKAQENGTIGIDEVTEYFLVGSELHASRDCCDSGARRGERGGLGDFGVLEVSVTRWWDRAQVIDALDDVDRHGSPIPATRSEREHELTRRPLAGLHHSRQGERTVELILAEFVEELLWPERS